MIGNALTHLTHHRHHLWRVVAVTLLALLAYLLLSDAAASEPSAPEFEQSGLLPEDSGDHSERSRRSWALVVPDVILP